jgi:hypothetical protein
MLNRHISRPNERHVLWVQTATCSAARKRWMGAFPAGVVPLFYAGLTSGLIRATAAAGTTLGVCIEHTACDSNQFCLATICESDRLEMPCTRCADCKYCNRSASIDGMCPAKCPNDFDLQNLQGLFTQLDEDGCISVWMFEHNTFRRYDTGVQYRAAISYPGTGNGRCKRQGSKSRIMRGHFKLEGSYLTLSAPKGIQVSGSPACCIF